MGWHADMLADETQKLADEPTSHLVSVLASGARPVVRQAATIVLRRRLADQLELQQKLIEFGEENPDYMKRV